MAAAHQDMLLFSLVFAAIAARAAAQCSAADNPSCANWARNGFCTNPYYTKATIQLFCPRACPNSGCSSSTTSTGENPNCAKWANDPNAVFCASATVTQSQKSFFCPKTCAPEIAQTDECAVYVQNGDTVKKIVTKTTSPLSAVKTGATASGKTLVLYVKPTCKVSFYADTVPNLADPHVADYTATASQMFFRISSTSEQVAGSFVCNCDP